MNTTIPVRPGHGLLQLFAIELARGLHSRGENVVVVENLDGYYLRRVLHADDQHASFLLCFRPWLADFIWC